MRRAIKWTFPLLFITIFTILIPLGACYVAYYAPYEMKGDAPQITNFNIANFTKTDNESIEITWDWWDEEHIGFVYAMTFWIKLVEKDIKIYDFDRSFYEFQGLPIEPWEVLATLDTNATLNFSACGVEFGEKITLEFYLMYHIDYDVSRENYYGRGYITKYIVLYYDTPSEIIIFEIDYLPYFVGGLILIAGLGYYVYSKGYYTEKKKTVKNE